MAKLGSRMYQFECAAVLILALWTGSAFSSRTTSNSELRTYEPQSSLRTNLRHFDIIGAGLLVISVFAAITLLEVGGRVLRWSHPFSVMLCVLVIVATLALIYTELRIARHPLLPLGYLSIRTIGFAVCCNTLVMTSYTAVITF